ncbi:exonuclease mut-7 homolog isoform X2 [Mustela erminea]|uniref:exonuclease mut-7 homolog isoform X2 n=1 Tax=Mustela erminea TaxID=36723 RepID=UPI001386731C|nr:exonuclease mut-7 homolog isoform X2 [Mustela erminea]
MDLPDTAGDPTSDPVVTEGCSAGPDPLLFLQALQMLWSTRELRQLREEARRGFAALADPRTVLLDVLESSRGWQQKGPSLEAWLTWELAHWLSTQPLPGLAQGSSGLKQLQARAVRVLTESPPGLVEPLVSIFQLQDADRGPLLTHVHRLHQEGKFKEAALLGLKLRLQPLLDVEKMSSPLLLQDRMALAQRYVAGFPDLQRRLLALLDSWCQPGFDIRVVARQFPQVTPLRLERLSPGVLSRQVLSLLERQGLDPGSDPLALRCGLRFPSGLLGAGRRRSGAPESPAGQLRVDGGPTTRALPVLKLCVPTPSLSSAWQPCATCAVSISWRAAGLGRTGLSTCWPWWDRTSSCRTRCGGGWRLPTTRLWPPSAPWTSRCLRRSCQPRWPLSSAGSNSRGGLLRCAPRAGGMVTISCPSPAGTSTSWPPGRTSPGTRRSSYSPARCSLWTWSGDPRLAQGAGRRRPSCSWPCRAVCSCWTCLCSHGQWEGRCPRPSPGWSPRCSRIPPSLSWMRVADKPALGRGEARGPRGLSLLVQQVLGKPLDKAQQLSNWDRRPLSEGQLVYAAADAYCLLEVYQALCREPARFCLSEDLARSLRPANSERPEAWELPGLQEASASPWPGRPSELSPPSRPGRGSGARGLSQAVWREPVAEKQDAAPEVPVRAFRAVCDSMLHGLARSLRCLGADVLTLGAGEDHRRAAEVARQEGRIILTSGLPYHKLRAQVGAGRCMSVDCSLKARQQAKAVLKHFNVRVTPADIFSRCQEPHLTSAPLCPQEPRLTSAPLCPQACNCDQYLKVSKEMMKQLVWLGSQREVPSSTGDEASPSTDLQEAGSAPEEAPESRTHDLPCRWLEAADLQSHAPAVLGNGTRLQLAGVPEGVLQRPGPRPFYCCTGCGKVFWEGSHLGRITTHFREVLDGASRPCRPPPCPVSGTL